MCLTRFTYVLALLFVFAVYQPAHAEVFTDLGLYGGQVFSLAIDPDQPDRIFAGIYLGDGLYFSSDGGNHFQPVRTGSVLGAEGEFKNHAIYDVKIAPSKGTTVFATNHYCLEKSEDGGLSWSHITNGRMQADCANSQGDVWRMCKRIAIHPTDPDIVYVGTEKPYGNTTAGGAVYKTMDGGDSWIKLNGGADLDTIVTDLALDPQNPDRVFVTTASATTGYGQGSLYLSENGGAEFEKISGDETVGAYYGIAVKPDNGTVVFTGCDYGLFKYSYDGDQWVVTQVLPEAVFAGDPVFDAHNPDRLYVAWKRPSYFGGDDRSKVSVSTDGGTRFETVTLDTAMSDKLSVIALHPTDPLIIYAGDMTMGCLISRDQGQTFSSSSQGIFGVITYDMAVDPHDTLHMIAGTSSGLFERKAGNVWSRLRQGIVRSVSFDPHDNRIFYAGISGMSNRLHKTLDSGDSWTESDDVTSYISHIAVDPTESSTVYLTEGQRVRKSVDGGARFETVLTGQNLSGQAHSMNVVAVDPTDSDHLYAGGGNFYVPRVYGDLWESRDKGENWTRTGLVNAIINDLLIDPNHPEILYAGCGYSANYQDPVLKSMDGGASWQVVEQGLPNKTTRLLNIWGASRDQVYAVGWDGLIVHVSLGEVSVMNSGDSHDLYGIAGVSAQDMFAVGGAGTLLHFNGSAWAHQESPTTDNLIDVWVHASDDAFAVGANGTIVHYDGNVWTSMVGNTAEHLEGVFGFGADDVYAVGGKGLILHYDGNQWSPMTSSLPVDTSINLLDIWGSDSSHIYAVGPSGTILFFDGNGDGVWVAMDSHTTDYLAGIWGTVTGQVYAADSYGGLLKFENNDWQPVAADRTIASTEVWGFSDSDVFVCDTYGGIFHLAEGAWDTVREPGNTGRSVVDLAFHRENPDIIYAATYYGGLYISPNKAETWLHLGTPEYSVFAIAPGSLYAGTQGKLVQCTGTGVVAGKVTDALSGSALTGARVESTLGGLSLSVNGDYMMVTPSGICDLTAVESLHLDTGLSGIEIYGGNVSWANIAMQPRIMELYPQDGANPSGTIPLAVQINDPDGIDLTQSGNVRFLINDSTQSYVRDLAHDTVRVIKLNPDEEDSHVTAFWFVYDRTREDIDPFYAVGAIIEAEVEILHVSHGTWSFTVSEEPAHLDLPRTESLDASDPLLSSGIYDAGIRITQGMARGATILYNSSIHDTPLFGSSSEWDDHLLENGVGIPLNLQVSGTFFDPQVTVLIPCPGYLDVSGIALYVFKDGIWQEACDTQGNILQAGIGFIKHGSRVNHSNGDPSYIEVQLYHFTGIQGATGDLPPIPVTGAGDGTTADDSGSFCFIAAVGNHGWTCSRTLFVAVVPGILFILAGCVLFVLKKKGPRSWACPIHKNTGVLFSLFMALVLFFMMPVATLFAATLFQQVGIASSPNPVGSGARATGMGGAFIAISDDATAASWNPSGLIQLEKPELSLVTDACLRTRTFSSDSHPEIHSTERVTNENINYLSATWPFHSWKNMVLSVNYQRLYDFKMDLDYVYDYASSGLDLTQAKAFSQAGSLGALGLSWALEMNPNLSVGLCVNVWTDQLGWSNGWSASYRDMGSGTQGGAPVTLSTRIHERYSDFRGLNTNLGFLWDMGQGFTLGAVIKTPFDADCHHEFHAVSISTLSPDSTLDQVETVTIRMPLSYGLGLAFRRSDRLTAALDIYRTHWSDFRITDSSGNRFNPIDGQPESQSHVSDTLQIRTGAEYLVLYPERQISVPLRVGFFYDPEPAHRSVRKFYGLSMGSGMTFKSFSFDVSYQYRWTHDVDSGNLIATSHADVRHHTLMSSMIVYF
ncbi:MAG: outer membrane protein transport protein [Proteobacteria bacterium]|nr:outer membrane protein transport protein [Pseudomonadota bacterium]